MPKINKLIVSIDGREWLNGLKTLRICVICDGLKSQQFEEDFKEDDFSCRFEAMMALATREIRHAVLRQEGTANSAIPNVQSLE